MKKFYLNAIAIVFMLSFLGVNTTFAEEPITETEDVFFEELVTPVSLSLTNKNELRDLGFTEEELTTMTNDEFGKYKELDGELTQKTNHFYEVTTDLYERTTVLEITEKEALDRVGPLVNTTPTTVIPPSLGGITVVKPPISTMSIQPTTSTMSTSSTSSTVKTSWFKMTTTSSKLSNGNVLLKNSFVWLKSPNAQFTDVVGITHSASAVKVPGTEGFSYKYTDGKGVHTLGSKSTSRNSYGIAKKFNLKAIGTNIPPYNHNGYISVQVKKGNKNDIRANAYGHYTHLTAGFTGTASIGLTPGSMSVGWGAKESRMPNTMILFNY